MPTGHNLMRLAMTPVQFTAINPPDTVATGPNKHWMRPNGRARFQEPIQQR